VFRGINSSSEEEEGDPEPGRNTGGGGARSVKGGGIHRESLGGIPEKGARSVLAFRRYCYHQYCMVYGINRGVGGGA